MVLFLESGILVQNPRLDSSLSLFKIDLPVQKLLFRFTSKRFVLFQKCDFFFQKRSLNRKIKLYNGTWLPHKIKMYSTPWLQSILILQTLNRIKLANKSIQRFLCVKRKVVLKPVYSQKSSLYIPNKSMKKQKGNQ